ncbi:MAG TPA: UTP--glucose-1-phosphate uridylyltransferase [Verrucomicrobiales bacterium]|nr:UTP--glucose-1-phosphate uridylyltransferase [Verrucomicrobiales bacterium]
MEIKKAVITCAGPGQRSLPLQTLVDQQGNANSALAIIVGEAVSAGVEEIGLVIHPGDQATYAAAAGPHVSRITFIEQAEPRGYGHAVLCAKPFTRDAPFLLMVGDHLYVTDGEHSCARQLIECVRLEDCSVSAVQATHESKLPYYGTVGGRLVTGKRGLYEIEQVVEKPTPTQAEQQLIVPGLRAGRYLCFFGMHAVSPLVMEMLENLGAEGGASGRPVSLSRVLNELAGRERYLAFELAGRRYDIGARYGLLTAQMAIALSGRDRDEVLTTLVDLLANQPSA